MRFTAAAAALFLVSTQSQAETYEILKTEGQWTLFRADGVTMTIDGKGPQTYDGICMAENTTGSKTLKIAMMPPDLAEKHQKFREYAWIQAHDPDWQFPKKRAPARLSVGISSYGTQKAQYSGQTITFNATKLEPFGIFLMFAGVSKQIDLLDRKGKSIAQFSTDGFPEIRDLLLDCAGL